MSMESNNQDEIENIAQQGEQIANGGGAYEMSPMQTDRNASKRS